MGILDKYNLSIYAKEFRYELHFLFCHFYLFSQRLVGMCAKKKESYLASKQPLEATSALNGTLFVSYPSRSFFSSLFRGLVFIQNIKPSFGQQIEYPLRQLNGGI